MFPKVTYWTQEVIFTSFTQSPTSMKRMLKWCSAKGCKSISTMMTTMFRHVIVISLSQKHWELFWWFWEMNTLSQDHYITWCRPNKAAGQVGPWQLLLQDGDNLLIKVLHGHGGDIPELLQNLVSSLGSSSRVHVAQHAVNLIYHLTTHNSTWSGHGN